MKIVTISYPNGRKYHADAQDSSVTARPPKTENVIFGKRGMRLEDAINESNEYYREHGSAVVYKKPTPVQIVHVDYPARSQAVIKEAYFRQPSTTDYNGVYQGYYLDFEAKQTKNKHSFPLKNYHQHQIDHFRRCLAQQGICFTLMQFADPNCVYLFPATALLRYWDDTTGRHSIPLKEVARVGYKIAVGFAPAIPYLDAVDALIAATHPQNSKGTIE
ncbi:Holliday junction-specific endonuclease [Schleiferilactobacillus perolens DSM 12744]|uniref:Holliday junction resolvase RecU n=1 Tax=Schleiferilactobacillus perolens DSM 12744 TaxID=1423792 RepID=A0A0R1N1B5_9LACO|nr:Holliday junction-specific endonuclease [Schleiferilactobacillus perolens DSM 12744]